MALNRPLRIDIWQGDWGLASIDVDCLRFMTYAKFAGISLEVKKSNNPFRTPEGALPVCYSGGRVFSSYEELTAYAKAKNICPDFGLTAKQNAEIIAYSNMLKEKLFPALQYIWWIDEKNFTKLTRPWYGKAIPFPFSFYYPGKYLKQAKSIMEALYEDAEQGVDIESRVYSAGEKCLTALSIRLGESDYLFGSHPTSLDATLYAYLAPLLKAPFPNNVLQNHLIACTNLQKFVIRISQIYFPKESQEYENKKKEEFRRNAETTTAPDSDFPNKTRNQVFAGLFAIITMSLYAFSTGIIQALRDKRSRFALQKRHSRTLRRVKET